MDEATVRHVAQLARLRIDDGEVVRLTADLSKILDYVALLSELQTDDIPPATHALAMSDSLREDRVGVSWDQSQALANAPHAESGFFCVPKVLDRNDA